MKTKKKEYNISKQQVGKGGWLIKLWHGEDVIQEVTIKDFSDGYRVYDMLRTLLKNQK